MKKWLLVVIVVALVIHAAFRAEAAAKGGISIQPGMVFIEDESNDVRKYSFAGTIDADIKVIGGLFADFNIMYYVTRITSGSGGNIQGFYPSFGAKYKLSIGDKFYPFVILGFGPYYHYALVNPGGVTFEKVKFGMNAGAGLEIMFTQKMGMDLTVKQYFSFFPEKVLKILTVAPGFKVLF